MRSWEDYICTPYSTGTWLTSDDVRAPAAVNTVTYDVHYAERISQLERQIEDLKQIIEAVSRENITCDIKELL